MARLGFSNTGAGGGGGESESLGHSWEMARAQAHLLLLADVFSLHGQEQLQVEIRKRQLPVKCAGCIDDRADFGECHVVYYIYV